MSYLTELEKLKKLQEEEQKKKKQTEAKTKAKAERASKGTEARSFEEEYTKLRQERLASPETQRHQQWAARSREDPMKTAELPVHRTAPDSGSFSTTLSGTSQPDNRTWFQAGALENGVSVKNMAKTALGTYKDVQENLGAGILGIFETSLDAGATLGALLSRNQINQAAASEMMFNALTGNNEGNSHVLQNYQNFQKDVEKGTAAFVAKDLYDERKVAHAIISAPVEKITGVSTDTDSVLGEKSEALVQSAGQLAAQVGVNTLVPGSGMALMGATAFGSEAENAFANGATFDEAVLSATITAGAELLTEQIGGIKFGGKTLSDVLTKKMSRTISNSIIRNGLKIGMDMLGEGGEELLSGYASAVGQKLTYMSEKEINELFSNEDKLESFIGGIVLGGAGGGVEVAQSKAKGVDYVTGLTKNEQAVVDKLYQDEVAEREKSGKVSSQEKGKIYDQIRNNLKKGSISTDTIESVLGGESYKGYQSMVEQEKALKSEIEALENTPDNSITVKQRERLNEARQQLKELDLKGAKSNLFSEVDKLTANDTMLRESYNERTRRGQAFEADLSKYDAKQQETVKRAIDSGILNNTNRTHEFVDLIAKLSADKGLTFDFTNNQRLKESGFALDGVVVNGFVNENGVTININSAKALNSVVGHEITHVLEGTDLYAPMAEIITQHAKSKGEYDSRLEAITKLYEGRDANIEQELVADLVGDYLFSDPDFIRTLSTEHRNIFQKLYDEIKYLCKVATAGSKEARELEKVKKTFAELYREAETKNPTADGGVKYSITEPFTDSNGTHYDNAVLLDTDFFDGISPRNWGDRLRTEVSKRSASNPVILPIVDENGNTTLLQFANTSDRVFTDGDSQRKVLDKLASSSDNISKLAVVHIDEIVSVSEENSPYYTTKNKHQWLDKNGWLHRNANVINQKNGNIYNITIDIAKTADGRTILYATDGKIKKVGTVQVNSLKIKGSGLNSDFSTRVTQQTPEVNNKNSLSPDVPLAPVRGGIYGKDIALAPVREDIAQPKSEQNLLWQALTAIANEGKKAPVEQDKMEMFKQALSAIANEGKADTQENPPPQPEPVVNQDNAPTAESVIDRDNFVSRRASQLYEEIRDLKKGVRASQGLGYLLDHGYEWSSIKTALLNIRDNPNQVVNENSQAEATARELLGREYETTVSELNQPGDVTEAIRTKMQHIQTEIANNEQYRAQANMEYDSEIAAVQEEYDAKKNKNTLVANGLLRRIERLKRLKNQNDANFAKRISDLNEQLERLSKPTYKTAMQRKKKQAEYTSLMENLVGDTSTWRDKKLGLSYKINTLRRNLRDIVRGADGKKDYARADAIYDELQGNYNRNEAALKREDNRIKAPIAELGLNNTEYTYAHMLGEFQYNPDSTLSEELVKEFYEKNKGKIDTEKVEKAIEEARKIFDDLIVRVNERLREQGMKEIPYRKGYFPHFTNPKQGWLAKLFNWKTVDNEIPTSIAGITETFNPERSWQPFDKQRKSDVTDYNLAQALDSYVHGALDWIYHIEDIQKRRALENYIRYIHSDEGVKARIDAIRNNEEYDADEMQDQIDLVYAEARNPLGNFVTDLRAGTNTLAAKKSAMDRAAENATNRKIYSVMTNLNNRVSANMVVGSISSAMTNFIPIVQSWMEVSPWFSLKAMGHTIRSTARDDGMIRKSTFLTNRLIEEEKLYKAGWDKVSNKAAFLMNAVDSFSSQTVWRSKYMQNISEGMSEAEAIRNADQFAENVIAGRSRGNMPTIFDAKNPVTKLFTAFQLEVNNQYQYMFKDAPQDSKNKARLVKGYATMFIGSYLYNALYSALTGRDAAFDPIGIIEELIGDLGDEEEEDEAIVNLVENIAQEIPFVGGLLGGGRVPISSAIPYSGEYGGIDKLVSDVSDKKWNSLGKEMLKPLYYLMLPMGGGQIKKTNEGIGMFTGDKPVTGSYTDSGNLRFPVKENIGNVIQAAMFGQYASKNARDYFDNDRSALKPNQIQEFADLGIPIQDYWEYREGLANCETVQEKFDYVAGLDLPVEKKNILINNAVKRKGPIDMSDYE